MELCHATIVSVEKGQKVLGKIPVGKPVTAIMLNDLFTGKSVNTPGFLLAVLVHEKLLIPMQGKKRSHEAVDPGEFNAKVTQLTSGKGKPMTSPRKKAPRTTPAAKKKAQLKRQSQAARKKKARTVRGS